MRHFFIGMMTIAVLGANVPHVKAQGKADPLTDVHGEVDGDATVIGKRAAQSYDFKGKIDGSAKVVIRNGKKVIFSSEASGLFYEGSKIDGNAHVMIQAMHVNFKAKIDGNAKVLLECQSAVMDSKIDGNAIILAIIPKNGTLTVNGKMDGDSQVLWCRENKDDPVTIKIPTRNGKSKVEEIDRSQMDALIKAFKLTE